ncbi:MAG: DUF4421 domain-containing protein [Balneolaceae bacterium]
MNNLTLFERLKLLRCLLIGFIIVFITSENLRAQTDSTYIQNLSELFALKMSVNTETNGFNLTIDDIDYDVFPNTSIHNSYTFSYRFLTLTLSFDPGALNLNSDTDIRGETRTVQYSTELRFNRIVQFLEYNTTKGYYLKNSSDFDQIWRDGDPFIQYPDVSYTYLSGATLLKLNPNLSIAALSAPNTRQLKTIGTFVPNISYRYYILKDDNGVVQNTLSQEARSFEAVFSLGYMQTFVFKNNTYLSLGGFPGIGFRNTNLSTDFTDGSSDTSTRNTLIYRMALISGFGYDSGRFYCGARIIGNLIHQKDPEAQASLDRNELNAEVFAGYRFNAPRFLQRGFNFIQDAIPFL